MLISESSTRKREYELWKTNYEMTEKKRENEVACIIRPNGFRMDCNGKGKLLSRVSVTD